MKSLVLPRGRIYTKCESGALLALLQDAQMNAGPRGFYIGSHVDFVAWAGTHAAGQMMLSNTAVATGTYWRAMLQAGDNTAAGL